MMQENELRIGNLIRYNQNAFLHDHLKGKTRIVDLAILTNMVKDKGYFYEPIPLTVEILEACGFKHDGWAYIKNDEKLFDRFQISDDGFKLYIYSGYVITIEYVHQLQNAIFSLTGEELKIDIQSL